MFSISILSNFDHYVLDKAIMQNVRWNKQNKIYVGVTHTKKVLKQLLTEHTQCVTSTESYCPKTENLID